MKNKEKDIETICKIMTSGQTFVDQLEDYSNDELFRQSLKFHANKTIKLFEESMSMLFKNINTKEARLTIAGLYDIDYNLQKKLHTLTLEKKLKLLENFDELIINQLE